MRAVLALLVGLVAYLGVAVSPSEVAACSLVPIEPDERIETFALTATAVVVGEVIGDARTGSGYRSDIRTAAALSGEAPDEFSIDGLGMPLECGSGPRMTEGERFLLFVTDEPGLGAVGDLGTGPVGDRGWQIAALGQGIYAIEDGAASYYGELNDPRQRESVGSVETLIREVGAVLDSDPGEVERAIAFANGGAMPPRAVETTDGGRVAVWGAGATAVVAVAVLGGWWWVRGRSRRESEPSP